MTDWQARALRMRREGHTIPFIAGQVSRAFCVAPGAVAAFLMAREREEEARQAERSVDVPVRSARD